jgi:hypothetical protein
MNEPHPWFRSSLLVLSRSRREQLRQPRDVDGDPSRLIIREHFCLPGFALVVPGVDVGERLWNFACKTV